MKMLFTAWVIWIILGPHDVEGDCDSVLGMQKRKIPDSNITASSQLSPSHAPSLARLDNKQGAWCSASTDSLPYIEIKLDEETFITEVVTQGSKKDVRWATKYQIQYLKEGRWIPYRKTDGTQTFEGNTGINSLKFIVLQPPTSTRSIRIYPKMPSSLSRDASLKDVSCLRLELKGCSAPVNGGWGEWRPWSECSVTCGLGIRSRERICDSPEPRNGGASCNKSEKVEQEHCRMKKCKKQAVDGGWGKWGPWSECSLTCGIGTRSRERKCDSPKPRNGGVPCDEAERIQQRFCRIIKCGGTEDNYVGYSGSGYGWETYSGGGKRHDHSSGSGDDTYGWEEYSENKAGKNKHYQGDSDDEDIQ